MRIRSSGSIRKGGPQRIAGSEGGSDERRTSEPWTRKELHVDADERLRRLLDQTATLHVTGSIEPIPEVVLQSVFYPTDYPDKGNPQVGLVKSQQLELATLAAGIQEISGIRRGRESFRGSLYGHSRLKAT